MSKQLVRLMMVAAAATLALPSPCQLVEGRKSKTTANKADYATGHGGIHRRPRNYDAHYYNARTGYALSPYLKFRAVTPTSTTPMPAYSPLEYGQLIQTSLESSPVAASSERREGTVSLLQMSPGPSGLIEIGVSGVLDRGQLLLANGEQARLRGVRIPSNNARDVNSRVVARDASQRIQKLTAGANVYLLLDNPVRDKTGLILVTAYLADGTEINRLLLEEGLAQLQEDDFAPEVQFDPLRAAQQSARQQNLAIWSR